MKKEEFHKKQYRGSKTKREDIIKLEEVI